MNAIQFGTSCCQRCRYYTLEGRRGGTCSQLNVPVQGKWKACSLATPVFLDSISTLGSLPAWPEDLVIMAQHSEMEEKDALVNCL
jgi:hypothetical protein